MTSGASGRTVALARGLHAGYGPDVVLRDVSLQIGSDVTSVILGPGGSGKSTLLRLLSRPEERPVDLWTEGELEVTERRRSVRLPQRLVRHEEPLGQLIAETGLGGDPALAVEDFWTCAPDAATALLDAIEIPFCDLPLELARLAAFTVALCQRERVFLLDEAEAEASLEGRTWMQEKLNAMRGQKTFLVVTHHLEFARAIADYVVLLVDGVVVESGASEQFFSVPREARTRDFVRFGS